MYHPPRSQIYTRKEHNFNGYPNFYGVKESNGTVEILSDVTGSKKPKMVASNLEKLVTPMSMFSKSIGLVQSLPDITGSHKSKTAAAKPQIPVSQLVDSEIAT